MLANAAATADVAKKRGYERRRRRRAPLIDGDTASKRPVRRRGDDKQKRARAHLINTPMAAYSYSKRRR